jgi:hypothetical protein
MGDKSPKSKQKNQSQKQGKSDAASQAKQRQIASKAEAQEHPAAEEKVAAPSGRGFGILPPPRSKKAAPREERRLEILEGWCGTRSVTATAAAARRLAAAVSAAAAAALFTGLGFVDLEVAAAEILTVGGADRLVHGIVGIHGHEREAAGLAAVAVDREVDVGHLAVLGEQVLEFLLGRLERQVAYIHFHNRRMTPVPHFRPSCSRESGFRSPPNG